MKKAFIIAAISLLLLSCAVGSCAAVEIVPDVSWYTNHESPYTINTAEELAGLAEIVNGTATGIPADTFAGKTVLLGSDIQINDPKKVDENANTLKRWKSIGDMGEKSFMGTFDGQNHKITGFYSTDNGLFASASGATVKNITFEMATLFTQGHIVGLVIGFADGDCVIENVHLKECSVESFSNATGDVGGIIGESIRTKFVNCSVSDSRVICDNCDYTGGIVGYIDDVTSFENCSVSNTVIACAKSGVGGIGGYAFTDVSFTDCSVNSCYVQSVYDNYTGGILGFGGSEVNLGGCQVSDSMIKGYKHSVGGLVGYAYHPNVTAPSSVKETVIISEVEEYVGGFFGSTNKPVTIAVENCTISNCSISGSIETMSRMMGVVVGRGTVSDESKQVEVSGTIIANQSHAEQNKNEYFNCSGTTNDTSKWIVSQNISETVNGTTFGTTEKNFDVPTLRSDLTTKSTQSPFPVLGILLALGGGAVLALRRK